MIRAIIIDDEPDCIQSLERDIAEYCKTLEVICTCNNAKEGIKAIHKNKPDVVFLDIEMPIINGFELLSLLPDIDFEIIFTTAYDKFALQAFKVSAVDYLLKPIDPEELINAVNKLNRNHDEKIGEGRIQFLLKHLEELDQNNVRRIALPTFEGLEFILLNDILYCESDGTYSILHFTNGHKMIISKPLLYLEEVLCDYHFFRVHNSFIINLDHVIKYSRGAGGEVTMKNGDVVRVSRSKKEELLKLF
ncbi:MAG: response regulator transcription factor [Saprospiraceae bacterium]|nr:response regulator transcription factor [Saprospiraceae bacterium]